MKCNTINKFNNCGKCLFNYYNTPTLENTSCEEICKAICVMICSHRYDIDNISTRHLYTVTISCTGSISITCNTGVKQPGIDMLIDVYKTILFKWYIAYSSSINIYLSSKVLSCLCNVEKTYNINTVRSQSIQLVKDVEQVKDNVHEKVQHLQTNDLSLDNLGSISKLSYIGILTLVSNILDKIINLESNYLFIDLTMCTINDNGLIELTNEVKECESTILRTKILYSKYLNAWCKSNFTHTYIISVLKKSINKVNKCKSISSIKDICYDLLRDLEENK